MKKLKPFFARYILKSSVLLVFLLLLFIIIKITSENRNQKKQIYELNNSIDSINDEIMKNKEYLQKGILNYFDITNRKSEILRLTEPTFYQNNTGSPFLSGITKINTFEAKRIVDEYYQIGKKDIFCVDEGIINQDYTVDYYNFKIDQVELITQIRIKNPEIDVLKYKIITSCWEKKDGKEINLKYPDFGYLELGGFENNLYNIMVFSNDRVILTIPVTNYRFKLPWFLTQENKFAILFEYSGGGWQDLEVIMVDLNNMTYKNDDNCATIAPISSENETYDKNCWAAITTNGSPVAAINDYGFKKRD